MLWTCYFNCLMFVMKLSLTTEIYTVFNILLLLQDGSYLAEFLLEKGYDVHGIIRRASSFNTARIQHLYEDPKCHRQGKMKLHYGDMTDSSSLIKVISAIQPTEIYNLAAQSHVMVCILYMYMITYLYSPRYPRMIAKYFVCRQNRLSRKVLCTILQFSQ